MPTLSALKRRPGGFTTVELLTALFIIAILAELLVSAMVDAREKGRQSRCISNERQLASAFELYAQDNDEMSAPGEAGDCDACLAMFAGLGWATQLYPYVKEKRVFTCPDDGTAVAAANPDVISYAYNHDCAWDVDTFSPGRPISRWTSPARTILFAENIGAATNLSNPAYNPFATSPEGNGYLLDNQGWGGIWGVNQYTTGYLGKLGAITGSGNGGSGRQVPGVKARAGWHNGGSNFAFADGHVAWLTGSRVSAGDDAVDPSGSEGSYELDTSSLGCGYRAAGTQNPGVDATFSTL